MPFKVIEDGSVERPYVTYY